MFDCGDNSCRFAKNKTGMRTNGGCRCFEHPIIRSKMALIINSFADGELINIKTATIEDLKQNQHVQGLIETIKFYGDKNNWVGRGYYYEAGIIEEDTEEDDIGDPIGGKRARAKLKEWE